MIEKEASGGDPQAFEFPRASGVSDMDFSFAGLKTSLLYRVREMGPEAVEARRADLAASYEAAIADQLASRVERALVATGLDTVAFGGGVAANTSARKAISNLGVKLVVPDRKYCTDNAAMIGVAALELEPLPAAAALALDAYSTGHGGLS